MGVSVPGGGGGGRSVDVDLNLVPFIDLMSCLVAFLLITAAWTNLAQIKTEPKGLGKDTEQAIPPDPPINISVLVAQDSHWIGLTTGDRRQVKKNGDDYDFSSLEALIGEYKANAIFADRKDIEVAAEDGVTYQTIISTMDAAIAKGFSDIGFVDPNSLSVRFKQ
ncbi:MAG: biopolymer transporter ExbD [Deltaproteobacteria bacterium]|nr:biopolymer transporter ExbD [Deltaproteobacteria bacterium]